MEPHSIARLGASEAAAPLSVLQRNLTSNAVFPPSAAKSSAEKKILTGNYTTEWAARFMCACCSVSVYTRCTEPTRVNPHECVNRPHPCFTSAWVCPCSRTPVFVRTNFSFRSCSRKLNILFKRMRFSTVIDGIYRLTFLRYLYFAWGIPISADLNSNSSTFWCKMLYFYSITCF